MNGLGKYYFYDILLTHFQLIYYGFDIYSRLEPMAKVLRSFIEGEQLKLVDGKSNKGKEIQKRW